MKKVLKVTQFSKWWGWDLNPGHGATRIYAFTYYPILFEEGQRMLPKDPHTAPQDSGRKGS